MTCIRYQFEGPFDSSYSLAILNREMARAVEMLRPGSVSLYSMDGLGEFPPNLEALQADQATLEYWQRSQQPSAGSDPPLVTLRNLYPPTVAGMSGQWHVMNTYGWEESLFPGEYVKQFNQNLHLVTVMSGFVRKVLQDSGVTIPVVSVGVGVDHILRYPVESVPLPGGDTFRFLHISSCFPRKGVDVLLQAYTTTFSNQDNVLLIIKTFPNPHNTVEQQIAEWQAKNPQCPAIHLINQDMTIGQVNSLYQQANALVAPSRGEGFGMPMAEAMLWGVPVITTGFGGQVDFCSHDTSWLVDYRFEQAKTHVTQSGSLWVEPDCVHLASLMRSVYEQSHCEVGQAVIQAKVTKAKNTVMADWCWLKIAQNLLATIDALPAIQVQVKPNIAWVSTWNTRCGIATYSNFLLQNFTSPVTVFANLDSVPIASDAANVRRCWHTTSSMSSPPLMLLGDEIIAGAYTAVVIQFNFGFFDLVQLGRLLERLQAAGIAVFMVFHATRDVLRDGEVHKSLRDLGDCLVYCKRLFVHGIEDVNRLKRFGHVSNVTLFPHGACYYPELFGKAKLVCPPVRKIAAYGFLLPGKGIDVLIKAFSLLRQRLDMESAGKGFTETMEVHLVLYNALYPNVVSQMEWERCADLIRNSDCRFAIHLDTAFHTDEDTLKDLAECDLIVFPYQQTRESASGAIRLALASGKPVACTPLDIFSDVAHVVHFLPGGTPKDIAEGLYKLFSSDLLLNSKSDAQKQWLQEFSWSTVANRLEKIITCG